MAFQTLYTGKSLAPELPQDNGKSMGRLSDMILKAEEVKYNAFRENEKEYLKASNVDPTFFISTANQKAQAKLLDEFNRKWAGEFKASGNNLSTEKKQQMLAEKQFIIAQQNDMKAKQDMWQQHRELVQKNPLRYDTKRWADIDKNYRTTGEYNVIEPPLKSKDFALFLKSQSAKYNKEKLPYGNPVKDEFGRIVNQFSNIADENIPDFIESNLFIDDQALQGLTEEFLADKSPQKLAYLTDTNKDGKITEEDVDENAVVLWAKNNPKYQDAVRNITSSVPKNQPSTSTKNTGITVNFGGRDVSIPVGEKRKVVFPYGGEPRSNLYSFGGTAVLSDLPTAGGRILFDTTTESIDGEGNISGQLVDYDADKDVLIVRTTTGVPTLGIDAKQLVEIPASNIKDIDNLPIMSNGKQTTLGEIRGNKTTPTTSGKKKWNPVTGKFE